MKIHLLSDLHLETGPYVIPKDLEYDVLVAAGDISDRPEQAIEFLKSVGKPVVYVLGNHDYWSPKGDVDMADRLAELKTLAADSNVHVLENESIVIDDTRFLGCTLWTGYGAQPTDSRLRKPNIDLQRIAWGVMRDFSQIGNASWWTPENTTRWQAWLAETGHIDHGEYKWFNPVAAYDLHTKSLDWLRDELRRDGDWGRTVVITHHAPSWQILEAANVLPRPLDTLDDPRLWVVSQARRDTDHYGPQLYRLAGYATPLDGFLLNYQDSIALWCHGHIHQATDVPINGVRVASNPRGYSLDAYRAPWKKVAIEQGIEHVPEGWQDRIDDQNVGDGNHNDRLVLDPSDGTWPLVLAQISEGVEALEELLAEIVELRRYRKQPDPVLKAAVIESIRSRTLKFIVLAQKLFDQAGKQLYSKRSYGARLDQFRLESPVQRLPGVDVLATIEKIERYLSISDAKKTLSSLKRLYTARNLAIQARKRVVKRGLDELKEFGLEAFVDFDDCRLLGGEITFWVPENTPLWNQARNTIGEIERETGYSLRLREYSDTGDEP